MKAPLYLLAEKKDKQNRCTKIPCLHLKVKSKIVLMCSIWRRIAAHHGRVVGFTNFFLQNWQKETIGHVHGWASWQNKNELSNFMQIGVNIPNNIYICIFWLSRDLNSWHVGERNSIMPLNYKLPRIHNNIWWAHCIQIEAIASTSFIFDW